MALSKTTQDHDEIQQWAEKCGAVPAEVSSTHSKNEPGILRFCFPKAPNHNNASLRELPWEEFFQKFDENGLELVYQEVTSEGAESNFNKLIYPTEDDHSSRHGKSSTTHATASHFGSGSHAGSKSNSTSSASHGKSADSHSKGESSHSKPAESKTKGSDSHGKSSDIKSSASSKASKSPDKHSSHEPGTSSTGTHADSHTKSSGSDSSGSKSSASKSSNSKSSGSKGTHKAA